MAIVVAAFIGVLKSAFWPATVVWVCWYFRTDISSIALRIREAGPTGFKLDPATREKAQEEAANNLPGDKLPDGRTRTVFLENVEQELRKSTSKVPEKDLDDILYSALAVAQASAYFERVYRVIFGSQLSALIELSDKGAVNTDSAKEFYWTKAFAKNPTFYEVFGYEQWLEFLTKAVLIKIEGTAVTLTEAGADFLRWMRAQSLPNDRPN